MRHIAVATLRAFPTQETQVHRERVIRWPDALEFAFEPS